MKRKLLTTIILGITITSMFISCGDSTKDKDKKETKKVETSSISAEKSTKTADTSTATVEEKKETETAKNEENSSQETSKENNTSKEENKQEVVSNNEGITNNASTNNSTEVNTNNNAEVNTNNSNNSSSSSQGSNSSSSEQKQPEQVEAPKSVYKDGTYTGYGNGMNGKVKVSVTISQDKIVSISVGENSEDEEYLAEAKGVIDRIIASQSTNVDVVSGATYSSNGIIGGVNEALSKAKN